MDKNLKRLEGLLIVAIGLYLLGDVAFSQEHHGRNTPAAIQEMQTESSRCEKGHEHHEHSHGEVLEERRDVGKKDHSHDNDHEGQGHDYPADERSDHHDEPGHENHGHGDLSGTAHNGHSHCKKDPGVEALKLTDAQKREINLVLAQTEPGSLQRELSMMGEIRLNEDRVTHVVPKVSGVVLSVNVSLGDEVKIGEIMASIESAELAEAKADYLEKRLRLEIAKKAYKRKKYLRKEKIASEAGWLEKEAEYLNAETALKTARLRLAVSGLTEEEIKALPDVTGAQFGRYELRAPMSGTVIKKHITRGEKLNDDSDVFTIADLTLLWIDLNVPTRDIHRVKQGLEVDVQSSNGLKTVANITLIGPVVDETTRTALARLMLDNRDGRWKPGTFVTGHVRVFEENVPMVVSTEAVQTVDGKDVVFVQEEDTFKAVPVVVGRRDREKAKIISGLKPGVPYVAQGAFDLKAMMITNSLDSHAGHGH